MPPPDLTSSYLARQQQLLSDIRDELRQSRTTGPVGGGGPPGSTAFGAPSVNAPWIHSQMAADKMLSGEWNTLGWSAAYSSHYKSTLSGDILGVMGLRPAPATMHQVEFERMASDSLATRAAALPFSLLTMGAGSGFESRSRDMASDLLAYSGRFMRAGSSGAGPMGHGLGMAEANSLSRSLQAGAITDLRMNGSQYNEVLRGGLQSGQFDFVRNLDELKSKFNELKDSVADVTRTNKMSVEETVRAFGQMRQFGMGDIGSQARALTSLGSIARVAGVSFGEIAGSAFGAVGNGFAAGMGAEASMLLAGGNMAAIREASRSGLISATTMARGGGANGIANAITASQQRFMGSTSARLAARGGAGGGGFMGAMGRGLNFGSLDDMLAFEATPMDMLDAGQVAGLHTGFINQQLSMMGVTDMTSSRARNMAFALTRGDMGDAAALAFADTNYTTGGQASQQRQQFARAADQARSSAMTGYDAYYNATSLASRARLGMGQAGAWLHQGATALGDMLSPGQTGTLSMGGRYWEDAKMLNYGVASGNMSAMDWGSYTPGAAPRGAGSLVLPGLGMRQGGTVFGGGLGAIMGYGAAGMAAAVLGVSTGDLGLVAAGVLGASVGGLGGAMLGGGIGGMLGADTELKGADAVAYAQTVAASQRATASGARVSDALLNSKSYQAFAANLNRTGMSPDGSLSTAKLIRSAAAEAGMTETDVVSAYLSGGGLLGLEKGVEAYGSGKGSALIADLLKGKMEKTGLDATSPEFTRATSDYVKAVKSGNKQDIHKAESGLSKIGIKGEQLMSLRENVAKLDQNGLTDTGKALDYANAMSVDANAKVGLEAFRTNLLEKTSGLRGKGKVSETAFDDLAKASYEDLAKDFFGNGPQRDVVLNLLDAAGGSSAMAAALQRSTQDFTKASATQLATDYHLGGGDLQYIQEARAQGRSSDSIRQGLTANKLRGAGNEGDPDQKSQALHDQAMLAIQKTCEALVARLTGSAK